MTRGSRGARVARALGAGALVASASVGCGGAGGDAQVVEVELPGASGAPPGADAVTSPPVHVVRVAQRGPLAELLVDALRDAEQAGERLVVMTNAERCRPCRRFLHALGDPAMREALAGVVIVRVDTARYGPELGPLGLETYVMPAFFLLDERGHARDGITGSEWTDDVAANIAPVMSAFVREQYLERRAPLGR